MKKEETTVDDETKLKTGETVTVETEKENEQVSEQKNVPESGGMDLQPVLDKLDALQRSFDTKIAVDKVQNERFDNMHRELVRYQNGAVDKLVDNMASEIIMTCDDIEKTAGNFAQREPTEDNYRKLLKRVGDICQQLQDILYSHGYETYTSPGPEVDVKRQKIIGTVATENESENNQIAVRTAVGYTKEDRVFRPERIKVYKYKEKPDQ